MYFIDIDYKNMIKMFEYANKTLYKTTRYQFFNAIDETLKKCILIKHLNFN